MWTQSLSLSVCQLPVRALVLRVAFTALLTARFVHTRGAASPLVSQAIDAQWPHPSASLVVARSMSTASSVPRTLTSVHQPELFRDDPGHTAYLLLNPHSKGGSDQYDPFLFLANDEMMRPSGFPTHPHRGFETVTYVISGAIEHEDNYGNHGVLHAGDTQYMTAGHGVHHSEMPYNEGQYENVLCKTTQLWVLLPRSHRMVKSRYQDLTKGNTQSYTGDEGVNVRVIIGEYAGVKSPAEAVIDLQMYDVLIAAGKRHALKFRSNNFAFLTVFEGRGQVGADGRTVEARDVGILRPLDDASDDSVSELLIQADTDLHFVFYSGHPIREPFVHHGPFVASNNAELKQTFVDYQTGNFLYPVH